MDDPPQASRKTATAEMQKQATTRRREEDWRGECEAGKATSAGGVGEFEPLAVERSLRTAVI